MELGLSNTLLTDDSRLIDHIVGEVKSEGIFDQFRKECIADVDTKPAYQNLRTRVEGSVNSFLNKQVWKPDLNKNQLRETLRKHIHDAPYLDAGVERIVDQVVNPKVYSVFMPQVEDVVYKFLGIERPKTKEKNGACGLKDLLPKDLDPVSPESDKNSFKDLSLESIDANDNFDERQDDKGFNQQKLQDEEAYTDRNKTTSENGHVSSEERIPDEAYKSFNKSGNNTNLNVSGKSEDKMDEEEEDSPTFEPIDIMNLNESNISNDSHLSGISELTSHRSRSPDFLNELSRDNFDCSNQDSQLSKVSSDSRLSIVTDFGSSNHGLTPVNDTPKDEATKDKYEARNSKDNFRAIREFDLSKNKTSKSNFEFVKSKDMQDYKESKDLKITKSLSSRESSRDATDSGAKDKYEHKSSKERSKDSESVKSKSAKEKISNKDTKYYKDKGNDKKKLGSHSGIKYDNKHSKNRDGKPKEKIDQAREGSEKPKDTLENLKDNTNKFKDEKLKETDKKDNISKEAKDLKDLYKEKIRELREKKELTEKEKLNKDKDKLNRETKDRKDPFKDRKSSKKDYKSSSSSSKSPSVNYHESSKSSKTSVEKVADGKDKKLDSKDKARREEKRLSKDGKSKTHFSSKTDLSEKSDKSDVKRISKSEKEDKLVKVDTKKDVRTSSEKTNGKKDAKNHLRSKSSDRNEKENGRKDAKSDSQSRDKKRREDKRPKVKDDHSSLRKSSNDRRSTDRDGSNGSNSKTSQSNNSNSNITSQKSGSSNLTKENQVSNSSSETSDSIEEMQSSHQSLYNLSHKTGPQPVLSINDQSYLKIEISDSDEMQKQEETVDKCLQTSLHSKRRSVSDEDENSSEVKIKKPKFAKNIHEAKKLMKIRKQMEKQKVKDEDKKTETKVTQEAEQASQPSTTRDIDNLASMPDDERVQIIEVSDEEYEEPYPEKESTITLDERSIIMLGAEPCTGDFLNSNPKANLSSMELCIRESLNEIVSNMPLKEAVTPNLKDNEDKALSDDSHQQASSSSRAVFSEPYVEDVKNLRATGEERKDDSEANSDNSEVPKNAATDAKELPDSQPKTTPPVIQDQREDAVSKESESVVVWNEDRSTERTAKENVQVRECDRPEIHDNEEDSDSKIEIQDNYEAEPHNEKQVEGSSLRTDVADSCSNEFKEIGPSSSVSEGNEDCRYFDTDTERSVRFFSFLESLELMEIPSLEDIIEILGGKVVSSKPKSTMAPPLSKPKRSSSPLSDILVNNNNDGHKQSSLGEDTVHGIVKKRKLLTAKKPRFPSFCNTQGISNGENFVMPLSPDSDVSATSEKTASSNVIMKEEKSRNRSSQQRYSSDDLYKPRPLFSSSSRRSRRSNQA